MLGLLQHVLHYCYQTKRFMRVGFEIQMLENLFWHSKNVVYSQLWSEFSYSWILVFTSCGIRDFKIQYSKALVRQTWWVDGVFTTWVNYCIFIGSLLVGMNRWHKNVNFYNILKEFGFYYVLLAKKLAQSVSERWTSRTSTHRKHRKFEVVFIFALF